MLALGLGGAMSGQVRPSSPDLVLGTPDGQDPLSGLRPCELLRLQNPPQMVPEASGAGL